MTAALNVAAPPGLLPPGLDGPPGLDMPFDDCELARALLPPGLEEESTSSVLAQLAEPRCQIRVTGIPTALLNDVMLEALFEQSGLTDIVLHFDIEKGDTSGDVVISLASEIAAAQCVHYFNGCEWGGNAVSAILVQSEEDTDFSDANFIDPYGYNDVSMELMMQSSFPEAGAWYGYGSGGIEMDPSFSFSVDAPCFVPMTPTARLDKFAEDDVSTDMGESEGDDDKCGDLEAHTMHAPKHVLV